VSRPDDFDAVVICSLLAAVTLPAAAAFQTLAEVRMAEDPVRFVRVGDRAVFIADDGIHGFEPWVTDGTPEGTHLLLDLYPGAVSSAPVLPPAGLDGALLFAADDGIHGRELWRTDGTPLGTRLVSDLRPGAMGSVPDSLTAMGDRIYFSADDGLRGRELWRSDGSAAGTAIVRDTCPGACASDPIRLAAASPLLFYTLGVTSLVGQEPWVTDGTEPGTLLVMDLRPGTASSSPGGFTAIGPGRVMFVAGTAEYGVEPWVSDGSAAGTRLVQNLNAGDWPSYPQLGAPLGDGLILLAAYDATLHPGVWFCRPDGAPSCTRLRDYDNAYAPPQDAIVRSGDAVNFPQHAAGFGVELWRTDGSIAGTYLLRDLAPGSPSGTPRHMAAVEDQLYFSAATSSAIGPLVALPWQVWRSSGSPAGTVPVGSESWSAPARAFLALPGRIVLASHHYVDEGNVFRSTYWPTAIDTRCFRDGFEP
jgi:ELWxxDGT repeat protein